MSVHDIYMHGSSSGPEATVLPEQQLCTAQPVIKALEESKTNQTSASKDEERKLVCGRNPSPTGVVSLTPFTSLCVPSAPRRVKRHLRLFPGEHRWSIHLKTLKKSLRHRMKPPPEL